MSTVFHNARLDDMQRRELLYQGYLLVYSPTEGSVALRDFAREMIRDTFGPLDPATAQHHMPAEEYAEKLAVLKPAFIHHPRSKECIQAILRDLNCNMEQT